jgi:hypothetical protein
LFEQRARFRDRGRLEVFEVSHNKAAVSNQLNASTSAHAESAVTAKMNRGGHVDDNFSIQWVIDQEVDFS